jgi:hypothetical protein
MTILAAMHSRNLPFAIPEKQEDTAEKILSLFFSNPSSVFRLRFHSPLPEKEIVDDSIFHEPFFQNASQVLVCFPNQVGLEIYVSHDQNALRSYLLLEETIDSETDIYLISSDLNWCICYIDEFHPDNSRMTFLYSNEELI